MRRPTIFGVLIGVTALLFGGIFLSVGIFIHQQLTPSSGETGVDGVAIDVESSAGSEGGTLYAPVVEFQDPGTGETFAVVGSINSSSRPDLGETWRVAYPPGSPEEARVVGQTWFAWIFIGIGAAVICAVLAATFSSLHRRRVSAPTVVKHTSIQDAIYRGPQDSVRTPEPSHAESGPTFGGPRRF